MTGITCAMAAPYPTSSIVITDKSVSKNGIGSQTATYQVNAAGTVTNHAGTVLETWLPSGAVAANYDVKATYVSGSPTLSNAGTAWSNLGTDRFWSLTDSTDDATPAACTLLIEIAATGTTTALDSATITMSANRLG